MSAMKKSVGGSHALARVHRGVVALCLAALRVYRAALSPLLGPCCRFVPSCSHYAEEALSVHGLGRGLWLTAHRLLRCHPFSRGGLDPVPAPQQALGPPGIILSMREHGSSPRGC